MRLFRRHSPTIIASTENVPPAYSMSTPAGPEPFEMPGTGDVVLRSVDKTNFYVIKPLLRIASPVFDDMCSLNRGDASEKNELQDGLPVVNLPEDNTTLKHLLVQIYPGSQRDEQVLESEAFIKVAIAAQKYDMQSVDARMKKWFAGSQIMHHDPLRAYAIAVYLHWDSVAKTAAMNTLNTPFRDLHYASELRYLSAAGYHKLLEYRFRCENAVAEALKLDRVMDHLNVDAGDRRFLGEFIDKIRVKAKHQPRGCVVFEDGILDSMLSSSEAVIQPLTRFRLILRRRKDIAASIDEAVAKVFLLVLIWRTVGLSVSQRFLWR